MMAAWEGLNTLKDCLNVQMNTDTYRSTHDLWLDPLVDVVEQIRDVIQQHVDLKEYGLLPGLKQK